MAACDCDVLVVLAATEAMLIAGLVRARQANGGRPPLLNLFKNEYK
jgi:hypothetical protein